MPEPNDSEIRRRSIWYGTVTFGLVSIPVALLPARRSQRVRLRMLAPDGVPLARRYYCPKEERLIEREEIVRGYEVEEGRFVTVTDEELESLQPQKSREIDLRRFVPVEQIDPQYLERPYFLTPMGDSRKAYRLLTETMEKSGKAGIATFVMRSREYLVAIMAKNGILMAQTLRFADEIRPKDIVGDVDANKEISENRINAMISKIQVASADGLDLDELKDEYAEQLVALAERKRAAGRDLVEPFEMEAEPYDDEGDDGKIIDLMQFLKRSVEMEKSSDREATDADSHEKLNKSELYAKAKELGISGRSAMSRGELLEAIREAG
ncbi:non-homologous end joining protein Ku [Desulfonatronum parangueonense]